MNATAAPLVSRPCLRDGVIAVPVLRSRLQPPLVLHEREATALTEAAADSGGVIEVGPLGVQLRSDAAEVLGVVDWWYDAPVRHWATVHQVTVTAAGVAAGETTASVLARVLMVAGTDVGTDHLSPAAPLTADPFRRRRG